MNDTNQPQDARQDKPQTEGHSRGSSQPLSILELG